MNLILFIFMLSSAALLGYKLCNYALCEEPEPDLFTQILGYFNIIEIKPVCPSLESVLQEFLTDLVKVGIVVGAGYFISRFIANTGLWKPICALRCLVNKKLRAKKRDAQRKRKVRYQDRESLVKGKKSRRHTKGDVARVLKRVYSGKK